MNTALYGHRSAAAGREEMLDGAWSPSVDIYENKDQLVLEAELPGMNRDDFDLSIENNVLTLNGERKFEKKTDERQLSSRRTELRLVHAVVHAAADGYG